MSTAPEAARQSFNMGTNTASQIDPTLDGYLRTLRAHALDTFQLPHVNYSDRFPGQRFAPTPDSQTRASATLRDNLGGWRPYINEAETYTEKGSRSFAPRAQEYMNPYEMRVVEGMNEVANRNFRENTLPALNAQFVRMGQHGSDRHQTLAREAARDMQGELSRLQGQFLHEGYEHAAKMYEDERMRDLKAAELMAKLSQSQQSQVGQEYTNLMSLAEVERMAEQQARDFAYQEFLEEQRYPRERVNFATGVLHGMPYSTTTTEHRNYSPRVSPNRGMWQGLGMNALGAILKNLGGP